MARKSVQKSKSNPKTKKAYDPQKARETRLKKFFNIDLKEFDLIMTFQNGVCFICKRPPKEGKVLHLDHDHKTGLIRGALDPQCNRNIARFRDDVIKLQNSVDYLSNPPATIALGAPRYGLKGRVSNKAKTRDRLNKDNENYEKSKKKT